MTARFTLEMPEELLARVDEARGDVPRNRWLRRAVEQALGVVHIDMPPIKHQTEARAIPGRLGVGAERPVGLAIQQAARSSSQAKRGVEPRPKKAR